MQREEIISLDTKITQGVCICSYGAIGVGKTEGLLTLPGRTLIYSNEPKDIRRNIMTALRRMDQTTRKVKVRQFDQFDDYMNDLSALKAQFQAGHRPCDSIGFDTISFAASSFKKDIEDDRYIKDKKADKRQNVLVDRFRFEIPDWGSFASMLCRLTWLLCSISKFGVNIVANAGLQEQPSYDRTIDFAPNFQGKEYSAIMAGFFDLVGLVMKNETNPTGFPPIIAFDQAPYDFDFVHRNCHERTSGLGKVMNYEKIINAIKA